MVAGDTPRDPLRAVTDGEGTHADQEPTFREQIATLWAVSRPTLMLASSIWLVFAWQSYRRYWHGDNEGAFAGALSAQALAEGRWWTLFTAMFLHGGIVHIALNSSMLVGLGLTLGAYVGQGIRASIRFLALYLLSGLAGGVTFVALNPSGDTPMVGASGAICGLWGAVVRLREDGAGLAPLYSRQVAEGTWRFIVANAVIVLPVLLFQLMLNDLGFGIAWEAHLGGYAAGLLLTSLMRPSQNLVTWTSFSGNRPPDEP